MSETKNETMSIIEILKNLVSEQELDVTQKVETLEAMNNYFYNILD